MTKAERRKHDQIIRKLTRRVRDLSRKLRAAESRGQQEVMRVREGARPILDAAHATEANMRALDGQLHAVAESLDGVGHDALIEFGLTLGRGFWRRLAWGIRFGITGRV